MRARCSGDDEKSKKEEEEKALTPIYIDTHVCTRMYAVRPSIYPARSLLLGRFMRRLSSFRAPRGALRFPRPPPPPPALLRLLRQQPRRRFPPTPARRPARACGECWHEKQTQRGECVNLCVFEIIFLFSGIAALGRAAEQGVGGAGVRESVS